MTHEQIADYFADYIEAEAEKRLRARPAQRHTARTMRVIADNIRAGLADTPMHSKTGETTP